MSDTAAKSKDKAKPEPPTVTLDFPGRQKVQPEGFGTLTLESEVTCTIKGKIKKLATNEWSGPSDENSKSIRIEVSSCSFSTDRATPMSMDEALEEERKTRKRA